MPNSRLESLGHFFFRRDRRLKHWPETFVSDVGLAKHKVTHCISTKCELPATSATLLRINFQVRLQIKVTPVVKYVGRWPAAHTAPHDLGLYESSKTGNMRNVSMLFSVISLRFVHDLQVFVDDRK